MCKKPATISKIEPFLDKYNWEWLEKIEENNPKIVLNVLYAKK